MKQRFMLLPLLVGALLLTMTHGSMQLRSFSSRAVKEGYSMTTTIDTLKIAMQTNSGLAISRYTMVVTPGVVNNTVKRVGVDSIVRSIVLDTRSFDSIEISLSFQLPSDFVADSMWLWIDGKPVPAYIQDRALASQQYQQIVGTRRDPAILETWGNGNYSLRIFPASSLKSRKIEIQFHHLFDDNQVNDYMRHITTPIPLKFDSAQVYDPSTGASIYSKIGVVEASFTAADYRDYSVTIPGLGEGTFSTNKTLTLSGRNVGKLDTGYIASEDPSGSDEFLWTGRDAKSELFTAGLITDFNNDNIRFEPEPDTRIIILDMRTIEWNWNEYYKKQAEGYGNTYNYTGYQIYNIWVRAQKYAVLALQQYLKEGQKFNVLIGGATINSVFPSPVDMNDENIEAAITAILAAVPSNESSTVDLLKAAALQAPKGIALLISDLFQPANYRVRTDQLNYTYQITDAGKQFDTTIAAINNIVKESALTLFTVNDAYQLSQLALQSGGFQLSGILNRYNIQFKYEVIDGARISLPQLPALFGSSNGSGLRNLSVTSDLLTDLVYTVDGNSGTYYYNRSIMSDGNVMLAKSKIAVSPTYYSTYLSPGRMLIAGRTTIGNSGKPLSVVISGKLDGLWFSRTMTAISNYLPTTSSYRPDVDPQWAFRTGEQLAFNDYTGNAALIQKLGKDYHMVTRQTSLLALEPGMELWEDTVWQQAESNAKSAFAVTPTVASRDMAVADEAIYTTSGGAPSSSIGSGVDFDGISLANILKKNKMAVEGEKPEIAQKFSVTSFGTIIQVNLPTAHAASGVMFRLYDLKGRLVAQKKIELRDMTGTSLKWDVANDVFRLSRGMYSVQVSAGNLKKVFRITLIGR
jgi:hypothetical protein